MSGTITATDGSKITGRYVAGQGATRYNSGREGVDNRPWWQRALDWAADAWNNPAGMLAGVVAAVVVGAAILLTGGGILAAVAVGAAAGFWMNVGAGALDNDMGGAAGAAVGDWLGPGGVRVLRGIRDAIQIAGLVADAIIIGGAVLPAIRGAVGRAIRRGAGFPYNPDEFLPGIPYIRIKAGRRWQFGHTKVEFHNNDGKRYPHWHIEEKFKPPHGKARWRRVPKYPHEFLPGTPIPEDLWPWLDQF